MKPPLLSLSLLFVVTLPHCALCDDLTTLSGKTYHQVRMGSVEPDGITYFFAGGVVKIPFTDLPDAIRKKYGYDPKAAAAFAAKDAAVQQRLSESAAENAAAQEAAAQKRTEDFAKAKRLIANAAAQERQAEAVAAEREKERDEARARATKLRIEVFQTVSGGVLAHPFVKEEIIPEGDSTDSVGGGGGYSPGGTVLVRSDKIIFVQGVPPKADGETLDVLAHEDGLVSYTNIAGANTTVARWVCDN